MDSVSRANGGIFEAEKRLQQALFTQMKVDVQVVGLREPHTESDLEEWQPLVPFTCAVRGPRSFGFAPDLADYLIKSEADLGYFVGLWKYPSLAGLRWGRATGKPFIVAPHGMLDDWALQNSSAKKRLAGWFFQNSQLRKASCIRALCSAEARSIRAYGLKNPICVIPNGIDLPPAATEAGSANAYPPSFGDRKVLLFLGRLHPKKGLANLIHAWASVKHPDWILALAGWDQNGHESELKRQATKLGIPWGDALFPGSHDTSLFFLGPQFGENKAACYRACDAFILPSFSEGLPMAILEAWSYAKPVLMTPQCNVPEGFDHHAALSIDPAIDSIARGLHKLFDLPDEDRKTLGQNGLYLAKACFSWNKIASDMTAVYSWIIEGRASPPDCVEIL